MREPTEVYELKARVIAAIYQQGLHPISIESAARGGGGGPSRQYFN